MAGNRTGDFRIGRGITDTAMVDVDGTLLIWPTKPGGASDVELHWTREWAAGREIPELAKQHLAAVNHPLVAELKQWVKKRRGARIVIWTMGGPDHAQMARVLCGFSMDTLCVGKPDLIIDDYTKGLLTKHPIIQPFEFKCPKE